MSLNFAKLIKCACVLMLLMMSTVVSVSAMTGITEKDQLSLKLRTVYFNRDYSVDSADDSTLAEGIELNYESGFIKNIVKVGSSLYLVQNIHSTGSAENNILPPGDKTGGVDGQISKIGQLYLDFNLFENGSLKVGSQKVKYLLVSSSSSRAIPNTFRGITGNYKINKVDIYGFAFDQWSPRHDDSWDDFTTERGDEIDVVWGLGAKYDNAGFNGAIEYLVSQDYLAKLGLIGGYTWKFEKSKVKLSGGYFTSKDNGDLFKPGAEKDLDGNVDLDGSAYYVDVDWKINMFAVGAAFTQVFDMWVEDNFAGDHGTNPFPTGCTIGPDLTNANEKVWMARFGVDFNKYIKGLSTKFGYAKGTGAENSKTGAIGGTADEDWFAVDTRWKVPFVSGLDFRYLYVDYNSDKSGKVAGVKNDETDHRVYLDYVLKF